MLAADQASCCLCTLACVVTEPDNVHIQARLPDRRLCNSPNTWEAALGSGRSVREGSSFGFQPPYNDQIFPCPTLAHGAAIDAWHLQERPLEDDSLLM